MLQHREESDGEVSEATLPPLEPAVRHIVEHGGMTFRRQAVEERNRRRSLARAMQATEARERAAASSDGAAVVNEAAAEGEEGCELAADESGGTVAAGQHGGGSDSQVKAQVCPAPTLPLPPTP